MTIDPGHRSRRFEGRSVIVTGAASGIGEATARRFAAEGAVLTLADLDGPRLASVVESLRAGGAEVEAVVADVADEASVAALVESSARRWRGIDVLVNNAGVTAFGHITELPSDTWRRVMAVDVDSVYFGAKAVLPHLAVRRGNIVNTCSISGLFGDPGLSAYSAAKGAVANLTRSLALDFARDGVRVNAVCPGGVDTPMLASVLRRFADEYERLVPLARPARPDEIAAAITFLASDDASYITGHNLVVDGGVTAATGQPNFDRLIRAARAERAASGRDDQPADTPTAKPS